jgi:hypothetical protein
MIWDFAWRSGWIFFAGVCSVHWSDYGLGLESELKLGKGS